LAEIAISSGLAYQYRFWYETQKFHAFPIPLVPRGGEKGEWIRVRKANKNNKNETSRSKSEGAYSVYDAAVDINWQKLNCRILRWPVRQRFIFPDLNTGKQHL